MFHKDKSVRDGFTLSLGGTTVIASVVAPTAINGDRLNARIGEKIRKARKEGRRPALSFFSEEHQLA